VIFSNKILSSSLHGAAQTALITEQRHCATWRCLHCGNFRR